MPKTQPLSILIPAAGLGKRMRSLGPKPLIELGSNQTVLSRQLNLLRQAYPYAEIVLGVGYAADKVLKHVPSDVKVVENELYADTNVVRTLGLGLRVITNPNVLIIYGDLVFNYDAIFSVGMAKSTLVVDAHRQIGEDEVGVTVEDGHVIHLSYGLPKKWAQILYLTGNELDIFRQEVWNRDHRRWFGFEILNRVVEAGGKIKAIEPPGMKIVEIDTPQDIEKARRLFP